MVKTIINSIFSNTFVRMIAALAVVGCLSGASLVFVYNYSMPKIKVNTKQETERAIKEIFPTVDKISTSSKDKNIFIAEDNTGKLLGYAFIAEGNGYQGIIKLLVGVDSGITTMKGIEVLESQETPGLGAEIAEKPFKSQFVGLKLDHAIEYVKNEKPDQPYEIEAITGATISSRAVVNILNDEIDNVRKELK